MSTSKPHRAANGGGSPEVAAAGDSPSLARRLSHYALAGFAAALLLAIIEWVDAGIKLTPVFASFAERLIFTAYFSLNLLSGAIVGLAVGAAFLVGTALQDKLASVAARGAAGWPHRLIAALFVCGVFAFALNQQWYANRFAMTLIREAEKIESLNAPLLNHERSTSYLILFAFVVSAAILGWLARAAMRFSSGLNAALIVVFALLAALAYVADSRTEPLLYEHSFHQLMFVIAMAAAMTLVGLIHSSSPRLRAFWPSLRPARRRLIAAVGLLIFAAATLFSFVYFDRNQ
ncbi:MAG TPA: hypothetical protein VJZ91_02095, partial [Blastocatellia bacterium]|nr:hypothetical protein [Blastocatellia bacterium]